MAAGIGPSVGRGTVVERALQRGGGAVRENAAAIGPSSAGVGIGDVTSRRQRDFDNARGDAVSLVRAA